MHFLFLSFITSPPRNFLYFYIVCKGWAEKQVLERFQTGRKGRKIEGPRHSVLLEPFAQEAGL